MDEKNQYDSDLLAAKTSLLTSKSTFIMLLARLLFFCVGGYIAYYFFLSGLPPFAGGNRNEGPNILRAMAYLLTFGIAIASDKLVKNRFRFLNKK